MTGQGYIKGSGSTALGPGYTVPKMRGKSTTVKIAMKEDMWSRSCNRGSKILQQAKESDNPKLKLRSFSWEKE